MKGLNSPCMTCKQMSNECLNVLFLVTLRTLSALSEALLFVLHCVQLLYNIHAAFLWKRNLNSTHCRIILVGQRVICWCVCVCVCVCVPVVEGMKLVSKLQCMCAHSNHGDGWDNTIVRVKTDRPLQCDQMRLSK